MGSDRKMGHVQPFNHYLFVFVGLLILTVITVAVAQVDLGILNMPVALLVATAKASLVVLFFMHGKFENKITWAFIYYPIIILAILIGALFLDYGFRDSGMGNKDPLYAVTPQSVSETHPKYGHGKEDKGDHGAKSEEQGEEASGDGDH